MSRTKRQRFSADFKSRVALEAIRGDLTVAQIAAKHSIHQTMVSNWKKQAEAGLTTIFSGKAEGAEKAREADVEKLHAKIGQLIVERDFLVKACAPGRLRARRLGDEYGSEATDDRR